MSKLEITDCRKEVVAFTIEMERILRKNDYKGGWHTMHNWKILACITKELAELINADAEGFSPELEAVDIANFAMMYYDNNYLSYQQETENE